MNEEQLSGWTATVNIIYLVFIIHHSLLWYVATEIKTKKVTSCHGDHQSYLFSFGWECSLFSEKKTVKVCLLVLWSQSYWFSNEKLSLFCAGQKRITKFSKQEYCIFKCKDPNLEEFFYKLTGLATVNLIRICSNSPFCTFVPKKALWNSFRNCMHGNKA